MYHTHITLHYTLLWLQVYVSHSRYTTLHITVRYTLRTSHIIVGGRCITVQQGCFKLASAKQGIKWRWGSKDMLMLELYDFVPARAGLLKNCIMCIEVNIADTYNSVSLEEANQYVFAQESMSTDLSVIWNDFFQILRKSLHLQIPSKLILTWRSLKISSKKPEICLQWRHGQWWGTTQAWDHQHCIALQQQN